MKPDWIEIQDPFSPPYLRAFTFLLNHNINKLCIVYSLFHGLFTDMLMCSFSSFILKSEHSIGTLPRVGADSLELSLITAEGINKSYFAHAHEVESGLNGLFFSCHKKEKN